MKAISIRQPWASAIIEHGKDIENRNWRTNHRGIVLVHAASAIDPTTRAVYLDWCLRHHLMAFRDIAVLERGGFIGTVEIVDVVTASVSPWFMGPIGFVLRNPKPLPFVKAKGALNLFNVELPL